MKRRYSLAFAFLLAVQTAHGQEVDMNDANALFQAGKFREAVEAYQAVLKADPTQQRAMFNGGMAAFLVEDFKVSRDLWLMLEKSNDEDLQVKEKLIQVYEKLADSKEAAKRVDALMKLRKETKDKRYQQKPKFCRDQFTHKGQSFMVFRHFDFPKPDIVKFSAYRIESNGQVVYSIVFSSNPMTNQIARETGALKPNERLYHVEGTRNKDQTHATWLHTKKDLSYPQFKEKVLAIVDGTLKPVSKSKR